jgi:adenylosuccinate synthase
MIAHALFNSDPLDADKMFREYADAAEKIAPFVRDTALLLNRALAEGKSIVFEGAQGTMLDIDHGTYPFVTSSSSTSGGAATGTGVPPTSIDTVIGITKAYCTRVGSGPFPSELVGVSGKAKTCASVATNLAPLPDVPAAPAGSTCLCSVTLA